MARVLIVEDDVLSRKMMGKMAHALGYDTVEAGDGEEGLSRLYAELGTIDVIVTDYSMPRKNGREFVVELGKSPLTRDIPVIMISGVISENEIIDFLGKGVSRFLRKPLDYAEVAKALRSVTRAESRLA